MKPEIKQYLSKIGSKGGSVVSDAKSNASRENGKLGGKPKARWKNHKSKGEG